MAIVGSTPYYRSRVDNELSLRNWCNGAAAIEATTDDEALVNEEGEEEDTNGTMRLVGLACSVPYIHALFLFSYLDVYFACDEESANGNNVLLHYRRQTTSPTFILSTLSMASALFRNPPVLSGT